MEAMKLNGYSLKFADKLLRNDNEIVMKLWKKYFSKIRKIDGPFAAAFYV